MGFSVNRRNSLRSPHVRGKAQRRLHQLHQLGITPACAGKSRSGHSHGRTTWDHPRVCGEKARWLPGAGALRRITPACAGKSTLSSMYCLITLGSPPRVRGKGDGEHGERVQRGITPACAGKRTMRAASRSTTWDHPRVCGEKLEPKDYDAPEKGSPPRVRGKGVRLCCRSPARRITPACAGKSWAARSRPKCSRDHPRVCGEKARMPSLPPSRTGSPPRVRGKGGRGPKQVSRAGITPACAGKSKKARGRKAL